MKRKPIVLVFLGVVIFTLVFFDSYSSYAFRVDTIINDDQLFTVTNSIDVEIDFEIDQYKKGIPGEVVPITKSNKIVKISENQEVAFAIAYKTSGNIDLIERISLVNEEIELIKDDNLSNNFELIYYGVIDNEEITEKNLGEINVEFKAGALEDNEPFTIEAKIVACPRDETSIKNVLGIDPVGKYEKLIKK